MKPSRYGWKYIRWFHESGIDNVARGGSKNAPPSESHHEQVQEGINVQNRFAITTDAYWDVNHGADIATRIRDTVAAIDRRNTLTLRQDLQSSRLNQAHSRVRI